IFRSIGWNEGSMVWDISSTRWNVCSSLWNGKLIGLKQHFVPPVYNQDMTDFMQSEMCLMHPAGIFKYV
ncbi:MAG TPA: hypothetical protein DCG33_04565, partial [Prevotellaceae bacterium]|nr:hypothetical protein [Prevotellaceae bacterium]